MKFEGDIFIPGNWFSRFSDITRAYWLAGIIGISSGLLLNWNTENAQNEFLESFLWFGILISFCLFLFGRFGSMISTEKIKGKLNGSIKITNQMITINDRAYHVKNIKEVKLSIREYRQQFEPNSTGRPWYSAGTNNIIRFRYNGKIVKTKFRIDTQAEFEFLKSLKNEFKNNGRQERV